MGNVRETRLVKMILEAFNHSNHALCVVELIKRFQNDMNKTTIYRILERLEEGGVLHSFTGKGGLKWFAKCQERASSSHIVNHPHFQCKECGKSKCLPLDVSIPFIPNHRVDSVNLLLIGQCEDCLS
ncbi:MAG: Fur family transcriptional regulator [Chitinophagales bacterium]